MIQITEKHDDFDKIMGNSGYQMVLCANSHLFMHGMPQGVLDDTPAIQWNVVAAPFYADYLDGQLAFNMANIICEGIAGRSIRGHNSKALREATESLVYRLTEMEAPYLYSFAEHAFKDIHTKNGSIPKFARQKKRVSYFQYYSEAGLRNPTLDIHSGDDLTKHPTGLTHKAGLMRTVDPGTETFFMALEVVGHKQLHKQMIGPLGSA